MVTMHSWIWSEEHLPELKGGTKRLPVDAVSFTDEITECDGKLNFYIPTYFDPDAVFGTHVCTDANDDWWMCTPVLTGKPGGWTAH